MDEQNKNGAASQQGGQEEEQANNGANQNNGGSEQGEQNNQQQNNQQGAGKTFTQEQVNRMMTREKNQGRAAALRELGIDPKDTKTITLLQGILKGAGAGAGAAVSEQQESENQQAIAAAERRAVVAEAKAEAMKMHAKAEYVDDVVTLALSKMGDDGSGDLVTVIGEVKAKYGSMFETATEQQQESNAGQKGTGSSIKSKAAKDGKNEEQNNLGARLAAQRKSRNMGKKSFWS